MRILFFGAGVIGSIYAAKLARTGLDVTVLARNKRFEQLEKSGITLSESLSGKVSNTRVPLIKELAPDDCYDFIIVPVRNEHMKDVLPILAHNNSKYVLTMSNTAMGFESWIRQIGVQRLLIGFPAAAGETQNITLRIKESLIGAGFPTNYCNNMDAWQKSHVALISPIANAIYKNGDDISRLASNTRDIRQMILAVREGFNVIKHLGYTVTPRSLSLMINAPLLVSIPVWQFFLRTEFAKVSIGHANSAVDEMGLLASEFQALVKDARLEVKYINALLPVGHNSRGA
ncbi:MAG: hypothetical protein KUG73_05610 [Pseudomonadales bacterium]|nr:hypothetical protein [Pseudomonadales bacterium]